MRRQRDKKYRLCVNEQKYVRKFLKYTYSENGEMFDLSEHNLITINCNIELNAGNLFNRKKGNMIKEIFKIDDSSTRDFLKYFEE